jgi:hypothetical protein
MQRDDDSFEEDHVLVTKRNRESADDTRQNVQQFRSSVELVGLVNKCVEAVVNGL